MANIRTRKVNHKLGCIRDYPYNWRLREGDVRICPHGKVQEAVYPFINVTSLEWVDLHGWRKWRAKRALKAESKS